eukprot:Gb_01652 [translate_table: standard]
MSTTWARDYAPEENNRMEIEDKSRQPPPYRQTDLNSLLNGDPLLLGKEDVKVQVEDNMLIINGEGDAEDIKYSTRVELPMDLYNQVKAGRKNGVLKITVLKIAKEKMKKVVDVKVE